MTIIRVVDVGASKKFAGQPSNGVLLAWNWMLPRLFGRTQLKLHVFSQSSEQKCFNASQDAYHNPESWWNPLLLCYLA